MEQTQYPVMSVLMPVYNEQATVLAAIDRLEKCDLGASIELVVIDDGSTDGSVELVRDRAAGSSWIVHVVHEHNQGKGRAIRTALQHATGRFACIYDADLEYDPQDMRGLLMPALEGRADVVFGVRAFGGMAAHSYWYVLGNRSMTMAANLLFNCYLRDIMTCYKLLPLELFRSLDLQCNRFDIEPEITGKLLARGHRIFEVPISYRARSHEEGKKLGSRDALSVLRELLRLRLGSKSELRRELARVKHAAG